MFTLAHDPATHKVLPSEGAARTSSRRFWALEQYPRRLKEALATGTDEEALTVGLARARAIVALLEADLAHVARLQ